MDENGRAGNRSAIDRRERREILGKCTVQLRRSLTTGRVIGNLRPVALGSEVGNIRVDWRVSGNVERSIATSDDAGGEGVHELRER